MKNKSTCAQSKKYQSIVSAILLMMTSVAYAVGPPDAGTILQQIKPAIQDLPLPVAPLVFIEKPDVPNTDQSVPMAETKTLLINTITISGNTRIDTPTLHNLVTSYEGKRQSIEELKEMTARITEYYHQQGYPLARTVLPRQSIENGILAVEVVEATYSKVNLVNTSEANTRLLESTLSALKPGDVVSQTGLDHQLMLLSDIPGVVVNATLKSGAQVGTSDLDVSTTRGQSLFGDISLDNYGNSYTGRPHLNGSLNKVDPFGFGFGDVLSFNGLSSGRDLNYARIAYAAMLNGFGTSAGLSYSNMHYRLGAHVASSDSSGSAESKEIWMKHPLLRTRDWNINMQLRLDQLSLGDHQFDNTINADRRLNSGTFVLNSDLNETAFYRGTETVDVELSSGTVSHDNVNYSGDTSTSGKFSKTTITLTASQRLTEANAAFMSLSAQFASKNLDSSQKLTIGGMGSVRAYDTGSISGDNGYIFSAELRHHLVEFYGSWNTMLFLDNARVTVNKNALAPGINTAMLTGLGAGLNWTTNSNFMASAYFAVPTGPLPTLVATQNSVRLWVQVDQRF